MTDTALLAGWRFLRSFEGLEPTADILDTIRSGQASGVTLFRALNVGSPAQVRELCAALQAARPAGDPPLLIALDQEGGQLQAVGEGATAWPGNLALGATGSVELARRAGFAIGREVAALGATMDFAPVCDLLQRESATHLGTRPFGDEPSAVARLASAMVEGIAATGVGTSLKHFPGAGRASADPHQSMPVLDRSASELRASDLPPFRAGIDAGVLAVMPGHLGVPAVTGDATVPATVSRAVIDGLLRSELGFRGLVISDAMNMGGATASHGLEEAAIAAADAGIDLLLMLHGSDVENAVRAALVRAMDDGRLDRDAAQAARERIANARRTFEKIVQPPLDTLDCDEHRRLAREIAERSVTLIRDPGILPLRPDSGRVAVIAPVPADLTPAETSSYLRIGLADELRVRGFDVDEFVMPRNPTEPEAAALAFAVERHPIRIVGTFDAVAHRGQVSLLRRVAGLPSGRCIAVALRSPYDAEYVPDAAASICTYGIQAPQIEALAAALAGRIPFRGALPVSLADRRAAAGVVAGGAR